jgi:hypothetical protein
MRFYQELVLDMITRSGVEPIYVRATILSLGHGPPMEMNPSQLLLIRTSAPRRRSIPLKIGSHGRITMVKCRSNIRCGSSRAVSLGSTPRLSRANPILPYLCNNKLFYWVSECSSFASSACRDFGRKPWYNLMRGSRLGNRDADDCNSPACRRRALDGI